MPGMELRAIGHKTGIRGMGTALILIGWLSDCRRAAPCASANTMASP